MFSVTTIILLLQILLVTSSDLVPECGTTKTTIMTPLIINASSTGSANWPWYAALYYGPNNQTNGRFFCGSTVISEKLVITAAHCVWNVPETAIRVVVGTALNDLDTQERYKQTAQVDKIIVHYMYQDFLSNFGSDIALLRLERPLVFNDFVMPVCVNFTLRNIVNQDFYNVTLVGTVVGMGLTEKGFVSSNLREAQVQLVNPQDCINNQKEEFKKYVTISSFCAEGLNGTIICNGDSGGGLAIQDPVSGKWMLEGIVSISRKHPKHVLCDPDYFTIYTKVGMFADWIRHHVEP